MAAFWPDGFGPDDLFDLRQLRLAALHAEAGAKPADPDDPDWGDRISPQAKAAIGALWTQTTKAHDANVKTLAPGSFL